MLPIELIVFAEFDDAYPAVAVAAPAPDAVVDVAVLGFVLPIDDAELAGFWLSSLFDAFFNNFVFSSSCNRFHSSSRSRSRFFSLQNGQEKECEWLIRTPAAFALHQDQEGG